MEAIRVVPHAGRPITKLLRISSVAALLSLAMHPPASAGPDADMQVRFCAGMDVEITLPDTTRADCISDTHAIEVEFTEYWHQSLGQALHYSLWTEEIAQAPNDYARWSRLIDGPRKAGIILVCRRAQDTCTGHYVRLFRIVEHFKLPVTIWDCDERQDLALADCQVIEMPK